MVLMLDRLEGPVALCPGTLRISPTFDETSVLTVLELSGMWRLILDYARPSHDDLEGSLPAAPPILAALEN